MIDFQYYPTPKALADLVWSKFQDRDFTRVLEPSAGMGHMIKAAPRNRYHNGERKIDVIEIDASKHSALRDLDGARVTVVGYDFLAFESGAAYSHIVGNPPFDSGAQHILHAWDILYDGEICMVLNAETVRNPYTVERRRLVSLIEEHGSVEYVQDAFQRSENEDVEREAQVTVAVVYLRKQADESSIEARMTASLLGSLKRDADGADGSKDHIDIGGGDVVLPNNFIENSVLAFDAAVIAMRESVLAEAKYNNFAARLGRTLAEMDGSGGMGRQAVKAEWVRDTMAKRYDEMKERAWSGILRSTQVHGKLSRKAQARVESEFAMISKLEFTVGNIHGFLLGLAESATDIQNQMFCDVFDLVTKYHSDNCVFYKGWKSNDRHRSCGMRMRTTRFILPGWSMGSYRSSFSYEGLNMLADFDRVFALLDGKTAPEVPLTSLFKDGHLRELCNGARLSGSYFDVRYYPGVGTIHFFATRKDLVDRLNRVVGKMRQWLPPDTEKASTGFWEQFDKAEKFDSEIRKEFAAAASDFNAGRRYGCLSIGDIFSYGEGHEYRDESMKVLDKATTAVLERHGIDVANLLTAEAVKPALLQIAAPTPDTEADHEVCSVAVISDGDPNADAQQSAVCTQADQVQQDLLFAAA